MRTATIPVARGQPGPRSHEVMGIRGPRDNGPVLSKFNADGLDAQADDSLLALTDLRGCRASGCRKSCMPGRLKRKGSAAEVRARSLLSYVVAGSS